MDETMNGIALAAIVASAPQHVEHSIAADYIELNHVVARNQVQFIQVIVWRWAHDYGRHDVVRWWNVEDLSRYPRRLGDWYFASSGGENPAQYQSRVLRVTWTENDPERDNAKLKDSRWRK
jgi:hypothetical protein